MAKIESIITEWFVRLPRGYASLPYTEDELNVLGEVLREQGQQSAEILEKIQRTDFSPPPNTGNDTTLKESLVCLFYDAVRDSKVESDLVSILSDLKTNKQPDPAIVDNAISFLHQTFSQFGSNYGVGLSAPSNLVEYIDWTIRTRDKIAIKRLNNALSAARVIDQKIGDGEIIREQRFEDIRSRAVELASEFGIVGLRADNWCPGDVYVLMKSSAVQECIGAQNLTVSTAKERALNSYFKQSDEIVAISLKEEKAQAGKATEFLKHVFTQTFTADIPTKDRFGTSSNKKTVGVVSAINRYEAYMGRQAGKGRSLNQRSAILNGQGKLHASVNAILRMANDLNGTPLYDLRRTDHLNLVDDPSQFFEQNKQLFIEVDAAIELINDNLSGKSHTDKLDKQFIESRTKFVQQLQRYNVQVNTEDPRVKLADIKAGKGDTLNVVSKKTAAYELASIIIEKWNDRNKQINDAYAKIADVTNPFAALTAFAIASAGISPGFWKVIGSNSADVGSATWFDAAATVDVVNTKTSPMQLKDTPGQAGFMLHYTTSIGNHNYDTLLVFRFSDSAIRIEVQRLV